MVLYFIGLGLGNKEDITVRGLNAVKKCKRVFLEHYTAILCETSTKELCEFYGCDEIILADRKMVEQESDKIISGSKEEDTAFLVVGDPFCATTHTDLLLRAAKEKGIPVQVIHNASIMNAVACCGLQLYNFGQTVSIPFWTEKWKPMSFYDKIKSNMERGCHTLCLLDIKVKEISEENLMRGREIYDPPRYMTIAQALEQLLVCEEEKKGEVLTSKTIYVGLARVGHDSQIVRAGNVNSILKTDFGAPLHSLVIAGKTHFLEEDVLKMYGYKKEDFAQNLTDKKEEMEKSSEQKEKDELTEVTDS